MELALSPITHPRPHRRSHTPRPAILSSGRELVRACHRFGRYWLGSVGALLDDAEFESAVGLGYARAISNYDPERGRLDTYTFFHVRSSLIRALRRDRRWRALWAPADEQVASPRLKHRHIFDAFAGHGCGDAPGPEAAIAVREVLPKLPPRLYRTVWLRYIAGCSVTEIARRQRRSRSRIYRDLDHGMLVMRRALST